MNLPTTLELDFDKIKLNLIDYLKSTNKYTDYNFSGSNINLLLDVLAYTTNINALSYNSQLGELYLDTAQNNNNVIKNAKRIGYTPKGYVSTNIDVKCNIPIIDNPELIVIKAGTSIISKTDTNILNFNILEDITLTKNNNQLNIKLYEGLPLSQTIIVNNNDFIIENNKVDENSIKVYVNDELYNRCNNIVESNATSKIYFIDYDENNNLKILFGRNVVGKEPINGDVITINYLISSGKTSNITNIEWVGKILKFYENDNIGTLIPDIELELIGVNEGSNPETIEDIKYFAPNNFSRQNRNINTHDYEYNIKNIYPNAKNIKVIGGELLSPPKYGNVKIVIQTKDGTPVSNYNKLEIQKELKKYSLPTIRYIIEDSNPIIVKLYPIIVYDNNNLIKDVVELRNKIIDIVNKFKFVGNIIYIKKLENIIFNLSDSILSVTLKKVLLSNNKKFGTNITRSNCNNINIISDVYNNNYRIIAKNNINSVVEQEYKNGNWTDVKIVGNIDFNSGSISLDNDITSVIYSTVDNDDIILNDNTEYTVIPEPPYITNNINEPLINSDILANITPSISIQPQLTINKISLTDTIINPIKTIC